MKKNRIHKKKALYKDGQNVLLTRTCLYFVSYSYDFFLLKYNINRSGAHLYDSRISCNIYTSSSCASLFSLSFRTPFGLFQL